MPFKLLKYFPNFSTSTSSSSFFISSSPSPSPSSHLSPTSQEIIMSKHRNAIVIYFDHLLAYLDENNLNLSCLLFSIFTPFLMKSEKGWTSAVKGQDSCKIVRKKRKKKQSPYLNSLNEFELYLIKWAKGNWSAKIKLGKNYLLNPSIDNTKAIFKAKEANYTFFTSFINDNCFIHSNLKNHSILLTTRNFNYYIPAQCSFQCFDAYQSLTYFHQNFFNTFQIDDKFLIIIDPPWFGNKSVKRKHCYHTQTEEEIIKVCQKLSDVIEDIEIKNPICDISIAIWTTEKEKSFVYQKLCPIFKTSGSIELTWHKITACFESAKIRGNKEYLIICHKKGPLLTSGLLITIPSSIHSHKPPITHEMIWTIKEEITSNIKNDDSKVQKGSLETNKLPAKLRGLEIYARYLRKNFHSIGLECLKLQIEGLFEK